MRRGFNKFYLLPIFIFGILFWALIKTGLPENQIYPEDTGGPKEGKEPNPSVLVIKEKLNALEGEIESQKVYSGLLLEKLKAKYGSKIKSKSKEEKSLIDENKSEVDKEKLAELKKELENNVHEGEVKSGGAGDLHNKNINNNNAKEELENLSVNKNNNNSLSNPDSVIAILVIVCNRPTVKRCLDTLLKYRPSSQQFPIIVSQDCGSHPATTDVLKTYGDSFTHIMQPDLSEIKVPVKEKKLKGYYNIARHYGFALNYIFNKLNYANVIIVEDDLDVAPDFFEYFAATLPILRKDKTLWCVSAWNDNGKLNRINSTATSLLYRTDFFPGLGWMLTKDLWNELKPKWAKSYWDDWMREAAQRRDRSCIRPEISRTSTFGKNGVSHGTYYQNHLRFIKINDQFVPFQSQDLSYLLKDKYDIAFVKHVYSSHLVPNIEELNKITSADKDNRNEYRLIYRTNNEFRLYAKRLDLMDDLRAGVPRTAYRGIVPFMFNNKRVYLAPGGNWPGYKP